MGYHNNIIEWIQSSRLEQIHNNNNNNNINNNKGLTEEEERERQEDEELAEKLHQHYRNSLNKQEEKLPGERTTTAIVQTQL